MRFLSLRRLSISSRIHLAQPFTVERLAAKAKIPVTEFLRATRSVIFRSVSEGDLLTAAQAESVFKALGCDSVHAERGPSLEVPTFTPSDEKKFVERPPIVCVFGHVDHGKTTLLDKIRRSNIASSEVGGITQKIGAFDAPIRMPGAMEQLRRIVFLDTPGHEAFTKMRGRGMNVCDIGVLVVAVDDGIKPQTVECIEMARRSSLPLIVALNKCDKHFDLLQRTKTSLLKHGVLLEEFGGDVQAVAISALTGLGIDSLLVAIVTLGDVLELRCWKEKDAPLVGTIIESRDAPHSGPVATVINRHGCLNVGDLLVAEAAYCRVRSLVLCDSRRTICVEPGVPVEVSGWKSLPTVGSVLLRAETEVQAKKIIQHRKDQSQAIQLSSPPIDYSEQQRLLLSRIKQARLDGTAYSLRSEFRPEVQKSVIPKFTIVVYVDFAGTVEALEEIFKKVPRSKAALEVLRISVGIPSISDLEVASVAGASVYCFNISLSRSLLEACERLKIRLFTFSVIYHLIDHVSGEMMRLLPQVYRYELVARCKVLRRFSVTIDRRATLIAGCCVTEGAMAKTTAIDGKEGLVVRVFRSGKLIVGDSLISSLRREKEDTVNVPLGSECGIAVAGYEDVQPDDVIELLRKELMPSVL